MESIRVFFVAHLEDHLIGCKIVMVEIQGEDTLGSQKECLVIQRTDQQGK